jgi:hypothetical protein
MTIIKFSGGFERVNLTIESASMLAFIRNWNHPIVINFSTSFLGSVLMLQLTAMFVLCRTKLIWFWPCCKKFLVILWGKCCIMKNFELNYIFENEFGKYILKIKCKSNISCVKITKTKLFAKWRSKICNSQNLCGWLSSSTLKLI